MRKSTYYVFAVIMAFSVGAMLVPRHSVHATSPGPCIGACGGQEFTPPATCIGGGGNPAGPLVMPPATPASGQVAIIDIPQQTFCNIVITQVVADFYGTVTARTAVNFGWWLKQNGTCTSIPSTLSFTHPMMTGGSIPEVTFQYTDDQGFAAASGADVCVGFTSNVANQSEAVNVTFVYR